ncbi:MAG: hypothetical protein GF320_00870 [Armatimonadia bacterium]|nr:hypothetical protein [Armatimonadia bacterium]
MARGQVWQLALSALIVQAACGGHGDADVLSLRLIYATDTSGQIDTCGCSGGQHGGLPRQATLVSRLRDADAPVALLDGGGTVTSENQLDHFARAYRIMGYSLVIVGSSELDQSFASVLAEQGVSTLARPSPDEPGAVAARLLEFEGHPGVLVLASADLSAIDPRVLSEAVRSELSRREAERAIVVLVTRESPAGNAALADLLGDEVDIFLGASSPPRSRDYRDPIEPGPVVPAISQGKALTVIDVFEVEDEGPRVEARFEPVSPNLLEERAVAEIVDDYYATAATRSRPDAGDDSNVDYVMRGWADAQVCAPCHQEEYDVWQETAHAHAIDTLAKRDRLVDECLACHSEEFRRNGVFDPAALVPDDGVTCATCHGDGLVHSMTGRTEYIERSMEAQDCMACHNETQQPQGFDFEESWEKIAHGTTEPAGEESE